MLRAAARSAANISRNASTCRDDDDPTDPAGADDTSALEAVIRDNLFDGMGRRLEADEQADGDHCQQQNDENDETETKQRMHARVHPRNSRWAGRTSDRSPLMGRPVRRRKAMCTIAQKVC